MFLYGALRRDHGFVSTELSTACVDSVGRIGFEHLPWQDTGIHALAQSAFLLIAREFVRARRRAGLVRHRFGLVPDNLQLAFSIKQDRKMLIDNVMEKYECVENL